MTRFNNKVVTVTGAGSGIGAASARRFAAGSATVLPRSSSSPAAHRQLGVSVGPGWLPALSIYHAAKGAGCGFTRAGAELGRDGIRISAVCPGLTRTATTQYMYQKPKWMAKFAERIPPGRGAEPKEMADVIAFLVRQ